MGREGFACAIVSEIPPVLLIDLSLEVNECASRK